MWNLTKNFGQRVWRSCTTSTCHFILVSYWIKHSLYLFLWNHFPVLFLQYSTHMRHFHEYIKFWCGSEMKFPIIIVFLQWIWKFSKDSECRELCFIGCPGFSLSQIIFRYLLLIPVLSYFFRCLLFQAAFPAICIMVYNTTLGPAVKWRKLMGTCRK